MNGSSKPMFVTSFNRSIIGITWSKNLLEPWAHVADASHLHIAIALPFTRVWRLCTMDKVAWGRYHHINRAAWAAPHLFHVLTEQIAVIFHACGESSSQRLQAPSTAKTLQLLYTLTLPCPQKNVIYPMIEYCWLPVSVSQWETPKNCVYFMPGNQPTAWSAHIDQDHGRVPHG